MTYVDSVLKYHTFLTTALLLATILVIFISVMAVSLYVTGNTTWMFHAGLAAGIFTQVIALHCAKCVYDEAGTYSIQGR